MRKLNPHYVEEVRAITNRCGFFRLMSMQMQSLEIGRSVIETEVGGQHLQPYGLAHGGVCSAIIDAAAWWAVFTELDEDMGMTTVDLNLNYLAPVTDGKIIARGRSIKLGRAIGLGAAEVTDQAGKLIAHGTSTVMVIPSVTFVGSGPSPGKFIDGE
ncbi:MAG: PaaI family thioesterase [Deltaproteobacteria bacterium]